MAAVGVSLHLGSCKSVLGALVYLSSSLWSMLIHVWKPFLERGSATDGCHWYKKQNGQDQDAALRVMALDAKEPVAGMRLQVI